MDSLPTVPSLPTTSVFDGLTTFIRDNAILMAVIFVILLISAYLNANFFFRHNVSAFLISILVGFAS